MAHKHSVYDTDAHFKIDGVTRAVKNDSATKTVLVQHDHNSERFTFELPRYVDGHDMSLCNVVQIHYINMESNRSRCYSGVYEVDDLQVSPDGDDVVICSWLISGNATQFVGNLSFVIRFACVSADDTVEYVWNTAKHTNIFVTEGIYNGEVVAVECADILEQWKKELAVTEEELREAFDDAFYRHADILADMAQREVNFAQSIDECTDQTKVYVLPDGYIYAYMTVTGALFTNHFENAVDVDGTPFNNGLGYISGYLNGSGNHVESNGYFCSGFIPYSQQKKIKITGLKPTNFASGNSGRIFFYASDKSTIVFSETYKNLVAEGCTIQDPDGYNGYDVVTFDVEDYCSRHSYYANEIKKAKYIRVSYDSGCNMDEAYILLDEEIDFGTTNRCANTGHAFVPADYEERIISVEKATENHQERLLTLEKYGLNSVSRTEIPVYIKAEADSVMNRVTEKQGNRSFNMVCMSDFHYGGTGDNKDNLIRACKAISYIKGRMHIDAIATLGDNVPFGQGNEENIQVAHRWFREINEILEMTQGVGIVDFRAVGNHDKMGFFDENGNATMTMPENAIYSYIGGYHRQSKIGDVPGGWCYHDFDCYKLRVIVLNTSESNEDKRSIVSTKQYGWLIDTLDLNEKEDAVDWQILILSHHPGDSVPGGMLSNILNAYKNGTSYAQTVDGVSVSCDFSGKNAATLIGNIHGHLHTYEHKKMNCSIGTGNQGDVWAISTPSTSFVTNGNQDNDGNTYTSVKDTAEETAFCVYSIDLDNKVIHAIHYGNGIDREINY